ncbi:hypothetical protein SAMN05444277_104298 [Parafilimonas terrae]|jgi:hypothetical protein|uniref:Uncharacterized protein n=1 Tax=Parafilimonas terrae TaxID=1465490 RepID=A0A1I5VAH7_9BACT|nr:hypothetical protein SAMN05444277_104298 [Parafilimonas terrae]
MISTILFACVAFIVVACLIFLSIKRKRDKEDKNKNVYKE